MSGTILTLIEKAVDDMLTAFDVDRPPVPVELMLQRPREGLWPEVDLSEMSASFLSLNDRYAPRMSVVRLLARHVARSEWGQERGLDKLFENGEHINLLARAIIMPQRLLDEIEKDQFSPSVIGLQFEVPEKDVLARLHDLGYDIE